MTNLLDVNFLIALAWPSHVHHQIARGWFEENHNDGWATCPFTQAGFVRLSSSPKVIEDAVTPKEAIALLSQIVKMKGHHFWNQDFGIMDKQVPTQHISGHRQVTDVFLLATAIRHKGQLVTLDYTIPHLLPKNSKLHHHISVIRV